MKVLIAAAAAAVLIALPAFAQTATAPAAPVAPVPPTQCSAFVPPPTSPDGATATRQAMEAGIAAFNAWHAGYLASLECLRAESQAAQAITQARVAAYNAGAETLNSASQAWTAESAEFNARNTPAPSNRPAHGASITRSDH